MRHIDYRREIQRLRPVFPGDTRFACQPFCDAGGNFTLTVRPGNNRVLPECAASRNGDRRPRVAMDRRRAGARRQRRHHGHLVECPQTGRIPGKATTTTAWLTDIDVNRRTVEEFITCGPVR